ncbi:MAG: hypothetical protein HZA16_01405, partial [Nitrospirae bacterium]|nr:hypothetical protein [Nitrospirota bacterium]
MKDKKWSARYLSATVFAVVLLLTVNMLHAAGQSSANYQIPTDVISGGGGDSGSANYSTSHTTGQSTAIGESSSANFTNQAGFWYTFYGVGTSCETGPAIGSINVEGCLSELCKSDLSASASDECGGNLTYTWTPLNGGAIIGSGASVQFDPPDAGPHPCPYQVQLTVTSDVSGLSSNQTVDVRIKMAGDVNGDGVVNLMDKLLVRQHFGQSVGDPNWDVRADATCDGVVNLMDKL